TVGIAESGIELAQRGASTTRRANNFDFGIEAQQRGRGVTGKNRPAFRASGRDMAQVTIFLDAEPTRLSPCERLVVPEAARVEADVSPDCAHVAQHGRGDRGRSFGQHRIMLPQKLRMLDVGKRGKCANLNGVSVLRTNSLQAGNMADIEQIFRLEELLPHGRNEIGAASNHTDVTNVFSEIADRVFDGARPEQLKGGQAQSSPPTGASRRAGSSGCRSGPLPRNQSDPPCSRKRSGDVGSTPSVRLIFFN